MYSQVYFRLEFIMEAKTMNPDQTPLGAVWSGSKLFAIIAAEERVDLLITFLFPNSLDPD